MTQSLIDEIGKYLETEAAKQKGFTNVTQFVTSTIRDKLDELTKSHKIILETKDYGYIELIVQYGELFCKMHKSPSSDCIHIEQIKKNKNLISNLEKYGVFITNKKAKDVGLELKSKTTSNYPSKE